MVSKLLETSLPSYTSYLIAVIDSIARDIPGSVGSAVLQ